tara:strand:+ start:506 stop:721 length:216 start_codon:yes stop_codon:yes gene_type:complete
MVEHSQAVVKAIDFVTYSCSGWVCVSAYINHHSTLIALGIAFCSLLVSLIYKHLNYRNEKKKLDTMFGQED